MKSNTLCILIEQMRSARNISQTEFVGDVISMRQYRRYLKGESDLPFTVLDQLAAKLGLTTDTILREFETARIKETKKINRLYNLVVNYAFDQFLEEKNHISKNNIIERSNLLLYEHSLTLYDFYKKNISQFQVRDVNELLVNYPDVLSQGMINTIEMLILTFLIDVVNQNEQNQIIERLSIYISDPKTIITGGNDKAFILILAKLAKHSGILENYPRVIELCNVGIKHNKDRYSYYLMDYFYYYQSLAYYRLNQMEQFKDALKKCFHVLEFEDNKRKINKFNDLISEDYDIDFKQYVLNLYHHNKI